MVLLPGLHAGLGIPGAHTEGPAPVPGKLVQGVHGGCLHPGEATRGVLHLEAGRAVRVDLGHEDWEDKVECPAATTARKGPTKAYSMHLLDTDGVTVGCG